MQVYDIQNKTKACTKEKSEKYVIYLCCRAGTVCSFSPCLSKDANTSRSATWSTNLLLPNDLSLCSPSSLPFSPFPARSGPSAGLASTSSARKSIADTISWQLLGLSSEAILKPASSRIRSSWTDSSLAWWRLCRTVVAVRSSFACWRWTRKFSRATRINFIFLRRCLCCSKHKERLWRVCCRWDWSSMWLGSSEPLALWRRLSSLSIVSSRRWAKKRGVFVKWAWSKETYEKRSERWLWCWSMSIQAFFNKK